MQENERYSTAPVDTYAWIGRDLTLQGFSGSLAPQKTDARGVPDYRGGAFSPYLKPNEPNYQDGWTFVSPTAGEAVYYVANAGADRHLTFWDRASENRLIKVENGKVQWVVGQHDPKGGFAAFSTVSGVAGIVDDVVLAHNVSPANYLAFTTDGMTLGDVLADENGETPAVGPTAINIESFTGLFAKDPKTGKNLLFSVTSGDDRILEVTGPGPITRLDGEVSLDTSRPRLVEAANTTEIEYQNWVGNNAGNLQIDGEADEWPLESRGLPLSQNGVLIGDIRLRRDAGSLFVLADILDRAPLENGEGVELQLAPETGEPTRIFLSAAQDKKGVWKGAATLEKAGASIPASGAKVAVALRWNGLGTRLEAQIPLELLPDVSAPRQQKVRFAAKNERNGKMSALESKTANVPDLKGLLRLQAAIISLQKGAPTRASWPLQNAEKAVWGTATAP